MGGKGSGIRKQPRHLPKRYRPGVIRRLDARSAISRELRHDHDAIVAIHRGGPENVTPLEGMLIEQLVFANAWRRRVEEQAVKTGQLDVQRYVALVDRVHGIAKTIGLKRALKDAPSLAELIAQEKKE
jgi:hypothetical protein